MVLGGLKMYWCVCVKHMYGWVVMICLLCGFCNAAICFKILVAQSCVGICISRWSQVFRSGLSVVMYAYNILGGGWC